MFRIKIEKDGNEPSIFDVTSKQAFIGAISALIDTLQADMNEERVWDEILDECDNTFSDKHDFYNWLREMKSHNLMVDYFDYDEFKERAADEYIGDNSEWSTADDLISAEDELKCDMEKIQDITSKWVEE